MTAMRAAVSIVVGVTLFGRTFEAGVAANPEGPLRKFEYSQIHMGIRVNVTLFAKTPERGEEAAKAAFGEFARLEAIMSDYRPDSELMKFCARAGEGPVRVSEDLFRVLDFGQKVARKTRGAFDLTCSPVVRLWRTARREGKLPDPSALDAALSMVDYRKLKLNAQARTAALEKKGMQIDLGGIAKGYACDAAIAKLRQVGVNRAMVEGGGDLAVSAPPPGKEGWTVEILNSGLEPMVLKDAAVSTSGDAYQFVEIGGKRYSHIVDPRTGIGMTNRLQASVVAPRGLTTDPWATAMCVLGERHGRSLARDLCLKVVFVPACVQL